MGWFLVGDGVHLLGFSILATLIAQIAAEFVIAFLLKREKYEHAEIIIDRTGQRFSIALDPALSRDEQLAVVDKFIASHCLPK